MTIESGTLNTETEITGSMYIPDRNGVLHFIPADRHPLGDATVPLWLPEEKPEHLIIIMDGNRAFDAWYETGLGAAPMGIETAVSDLIGTESIPPSAILGITFRRLNADKRQRAESPEAVADYIFREILPVLNNDFGIPVSKVTLAGASGGASQTAQAVVRYPDRIANALCFCPGASFKDIPIENHHGIRIALHSGGRDLPGCLDGILSKSSQLIEAGWNMPEDLLTVVDWEAFHGLKAVRKALPVLLRWALGDMPAAGPAHIRTLADELSEPIKAETLGEWNRLFLAQSLTDTIDAVHPDAEFHSQDTTVFSIQAENRICITDSGTSIVTGKRQSEKAGRSVEVNADQPEHFPCTKMNTDNRILPYRITDFSGRVAAVFSMQYDDHELCCSADVYDRNVIKQENSRFEASELHRMAWNPELHRRDSRDLGRSGLELWIDARPEPVRSLNRGIRSKADTIEFLQLHPGVGIDGKAVLSPYPPKQVPQPDCSAELILTDFGYSAEIKIPVDWLDLEQGKPWEGFRMNLGVLMFKEDPMDRPALNWWQPHWSSLNNHTGSGEFIRT